MKQAAECSREVKAVPETPSPADLAGRGSAAEELLVSGLSSTWAGVLTGKSSDDAWFRLPWITAQGMGPR